MCGIAGIVGGLSAEEAQSAVARMLDRLRHRGPDDKGLSATELGPDSLCLGSTRLAILDLSPAGRMPLRDPETGTEIVYNGEVYNYREIRRELEETGARFCSRTDTEVVLKAYARWGAECLRCLRGMFAFAIWDPSRRELFLARDPVGKKPLYYVRVAGAGTERFVFASEVRALLASGTVERRLDPVGLDAYLANGFPVAPTTMIKDVVALLPGHCMRVAADGRVREIANYAALQAEAASSSPEPPVDLIRERFDRAVRRRLRSDVPVGIFLSAGLDSSAIAGAAARAGASVVAVSVGIGEAGLDESSEAARLAGRLGVEHRVVHLTERLFFEWLPDALAGMDQPSFDGLNVYAASRAAHEAGLKVALSGLGADELFGGYPWFRSTAVLARLAPAMSLLPKWVATAACKHLTAGRPRVAGLWKSLDLLDPDAEDGGAPGVLRAYQARQMLFPSWQRRALRADCDGDQLLPWGLPQQFTTWLSPQLDGGERWNALSTAAWRLFLGERCLRDTDQMSMAVSLEVRAPFTDVDFVRSVRAIGARRRMGDAPRKSYELEIVRPYLSKPEPHGSKRGFVFPFERWLRKRAPGASEIDAALTDREAVAAAGIDGRVVERLLAGFRGGERVPWSRIWALYVLVQWCQRNGVTA